MTDPDLELLRPDLPRGRYRAVLFDFDGTLSLIREGWDRIMVPMMVEALVADRDRRTPRPSSASSSKSS